MKMPMKMQWTESIKSIALCLTGCLVIAGCAQEKVQTAGQRPLPKIPTEVKSTVPDKYKTGQWPVHPNDDLESKHSLLLNSEQVTMLDKWTARLDFTTEIPTPSVKVYYGVYEPDAVLPWPRYRGSAQEKIDGVSKRHSVELDIKRLAKAKVDIAGLAEKGGGVITYRLEIYNPEAAAVKFYQRRFEMYNGKLVPTIIEGPFVDLITPTGAVVSWETDSPVTGTVKVKSKGGKIVKKFQTQGKEGTHFEVAVNDLSPGVTYNYTVENTNGIDTTMSRQYYFSTPAEHAAQFNFAVLGDSREGGGGGDYDFNGVNATALRNVVTEAFKNDAAFIVNTGDLINGYTTSILDFQMQLESYKDVVEEVRHYLPMYEMMGNHEALLDVYFRDEAPEEKGGITYFPMLMFDKEGENSSEVVFGKEFINPQNGPEVNNAAANVPKGKMQPTYKENVYYVDYGNARLIMMNNNYWINGLPEKYGGNLEGYILDDQYEWLLKLFQQTREDDSIDHVFIFAQEPFFPVGWQSNTGMWYQGGDPKKNGGYDRSYVSERRDQIWNAFIATGKAVAGNFGDEHNYSRTLVTKDRNGKPYPKPVWQIITGGAGAPFASLETDLPWSDGVKKHSPQMHFALYKVDGKQVFLETYSLDGLLIDSVELTQTDE
ncbi:MAG: hypothetical protein D3916_02760 [Candidatus Electrothrix sp. MAN1_4]|nr:hypothetical protein [Candidatus Electrothrix sp. MAN1_4]